MSNLDCSRLIPVALDTFTFPNHPFALDLSSHVCMCVCFLCRTSFTNLASPYSTTQTLLTAYLANTASNAAYNALYASVNTNTGYSQQFVAAAATACTLRCGCNPWYRDS